MFCKNLKARSYFETPDLDMGVVGFGKQSIEYLRKNERLKVGVYVLYKEDVVIYVGKSINIISRIYQHKCNGVDYDYAIVYNFKSPQDMHIIEPYLIGMYRPKLNLDSNSSSSSVKIKWLKFVKRKTKLDIRY